jgi:DNA-binding MltR family transcriptional regulator
MVWMTDSEAEADAIRELKHTSDRAAAIVGASMLELSIETLLKRVLLDYKRNKDNSVHGDMFRSSGPLGSFSAKINLAFMLGLCSAEAWRDLDYVRAIRNAFAHRIEAQRFSVEQIKAWCENLKAFEAHSFPRGADHSNIPRGPGPNLFEEGLAEKLVDPRERYLLCVRYYLAAFRMIAISEEPSPLARQLC